LPRRRQVLEGDPAAGQALAPERRALGGVPGKLLQALLLEALEALARPALTLE
jgi:hypothetical protein